MTASFIFAALTLAVLFVGALAVPLLSRRRSSETANEAISAMAKRRAAQSLSAQLADIDRARDAELLDSTEADAATLAAQREAIAAADEQMATNFKAGRIAAMGFAGVAPLVVGLVYFQIGAPGYDAAKVKEIEAARVASGQSSTRPSGAPAGPAAGIAALPPDEQAVAIRGMVEGLAARLEANPDDPDGWRMLARSQEVLGEIDAALASRRQLLAIAPDDVRDWKDFIALLARRDPAQQFPNDDEFVAALAELETRSPGDPLVLFYRGGAAFSRGDGATAVANWSRLLAMSPEDAPVRGILEGLLAEAEAMEQ
ncbi:MAG: c-type cytochrome biogenesis protein CcmI [Pseudomonadota bacterium]